MVSVLALSVVDPGIEPWLGQTKDCKIGICCFSAKHTALWRKSKDWLAWNQNNTWFSLSFSCQTQVLDPKDNSSEKHYSKTHKLRPIPYQLINHIPNLVFHSIVNVLSTQHYGERAKTGWLGIRIVCPSGMTCLPADCCFSELAL
jgi:hypothetical protein